MPLKLVPPRKGKTPYWSVRGTYLGQYVEKSTKALRRSVANKIREKWEREIECGQFDTEGEETFLSASVAYMEAGGERRPVKKLLLHFGETPIRKIDQTAIDAAALAIFPDASPATRNREVYTPVSAILKRAGREFVLKRPKGGRGQKRKKWLSPEQAAAILKASHQLDKEFGIFLDQLLFGGLRLSEQLDMRCDDVLIDECFAWVGDSKNGEAQPLHLTPYMVESLETHPRGIRRAGERVFRFHKGGSLDWMLEAACAIASGLPKPPRWKKGPRPARTPHPLDWVTFHYFRHTYGAWMRRYGGLDGIGLIATKRWKNLESVEVYSHAVTSEEARKADFLPTEGWAKATG